MIRDWLVLKNWGLEGVRCGEVVPPLGVEVVPDLLDEVAGFHLERVGADVHDFGQQEHRDVEAEGGGFGAECSVWLLGDGDLDGLDEPE